MSTFGTKRTRDVRWTQELTSMLINLWEKHENLYDVKHVHHESRLKRTESLEKICAELQKYNSHISVQGLRKKIHALCTQYAAEYKIWRTKDCYEPKLWCFEELGFLTRGITPKSSRSNIDINLDEDSCSNEDISRSSDKTGLSDKSKVIAKKGKRPALEQIKQVINLKDFFDKKLSKRYEWLGQQIRFKINCMKNESLRNETVETIEYILNENISRDKSASQLDSNEHKNYLAKNIFPPPSRKKSKPMDPGVFAMRQKILDLNELINEKIVTPDGGICQQVVDQVSNIQDDEIREETAWSIQCILKENIERDKYIEQHANQIIEENENEHEVIEEVVGENIQNVDSFLDNIWNDVNVDIEG